MAYRYPKIVTNTTKFYSGKQTIHTANRYYQARKSIQRKDTHTVKRQLGQLSERGDGLKQT